MAKKPNPTPPPEQDSFIDFIDLCASVEDSMELHGAPRETIQNFQKACHSLGPGIPVEEKATLLAPTIDFLIESNRLLETHPQKTRAKNLLPRSVIANATGIIIDTLSGRLHLLPTVRPLLLSLLGYGKKPLSSSKNRNARSAAVYLKALSPEISATCVAKKVHVSTKTVSSWFKDRKFNAELEAHAQLVEDTKYHNLLEKALAYNLLELEGD